MQPPQWMYCLLGATLFTGCPTPSEADSDGDGTTDSQDCAPLNAQIHPGQIELCDGFDNNCNFNVDEGFDQDGDGFTLCQSPVADCDDNNAEIHPGAIEVVNDLDDNCDGAEDEISDKDGDGFCPATTCIDGIEPGDCNDQNFTINPAAIDVPGDGVDNDCDGKLDTPFNVPCDSDLDPHDPSSFAKAIGLGCKNELLTAEIIGVEVGVGVAASRAIVSQYGQLSPFEGAQMLLFSNGTTDTSPHEPGTAFGDPVLGPDTSFFHPSPQNAPADGCGAADPQIVNDYVEYRVTAKVPPNAQSFSLRFMFMSAEYPAKHCSSTDDTFLLLLDSSAFTGNIAVDALGRVVSINSSFFGVCDQDDGANICQVATNQAINGTGYEGHGATFPLQTTVPTVVPGEIITLRFIIFDEGNFTSDSTVMIDNFAWSFVSCQDDPNTALNECAPSTDIP